MDEHGKTLSGHDPSWLFLSSEVRFHYGPWAPGEREGVEADLASARARLEALHAAWCEPWRRLVVSFVPDKSCVARRHLFPEEDPGRREPWRPVVASGWPLLGSRELRPEHYQPSDTHVAPLGGVVCARELASLLGLPFAEPRGALTRLQGPGDLAEGRNASEDIRRRFAERTYEVSWPIPGVDYIDRTRELPLRHRLSLHRPSRWLVSRDHAGASAPRVLLYGGSTCYHYVAPFVVPSGGELLFVWNHGCFSEELLRWYEPTHVAAVITERFSRSVSVCTSLPPECPEHIARLRTLSAPRRLATLLAHGTSVDFDAYHLLSEEDAGAAETNAILLRVPPNDWASEQEGELAQEAVAASLSYVNLYADLFELYAQGPSLEICAKTGALRPTAGGAEFPHLAAAAHFMQSGRYENRNLRLCQEAEKLDVEQWLTHREDLVGLTERQIRAHYQHEGRWGR